MAGERNARALARIDAAMRRIEAAAQATAPASNPEIEQRYKALWDSTRAALADLDDMIGALER